MHCSNYFFNTNRKCFICYIKFRFVENYPEPSCTHFIVLDNVPTLFMSLSARGLQFIHLIVQDKIRAVQQIYPRLKFRALKLKYLHVKLIYDWRFPQYFYCFSNTCRFPQEWWDERLDKGVDKNILTYILTILPINYYTMTQISKL